MGNPLSYKGRTLTWQGRRLISYGIENKKATYTYDFNNVRTSKTATDGTTSITSKYIYDGNNLIAEQRTVKGPDKDKSVWLYYIYGVDGIAGFKFEDKVYLYRKNVQGDITHIYRKDTDKLVEVAHYAYDAFGNTEIVSDTDKIGSLNPFRYRGYYFDIETKLYYLISRYYDPETCRFISADGIEYLDPETLGGLNLYAYCGNNPVMGYDSDGTWDWKKFWGWVVTAVVAVAAVALVVVGTTVTGGLLGAVLVGAGAGALLSMGGSIASQGGLANADPWQVAIAGGIGAAIGAISGACSYGMGVIGSHIGESLGMAFANATHIASEIKFGKVFGTAALTAIGKFSGDIIGGIIGGTVANYFANKLFGKDLDYNEMIKQGVEGEFPMWLIRFFRWL